MKRTHCMLLAGLIGVAQGAAADLSYTNLSLGYTLDGEVDVINVDLDGFDFSGSFALDQNFYLFGDFQALETDPGDADVDRINVGVGYHTPIDEMMDLDFSFAYSDLEIGTIDGDGYQITGGLRGMPSSNVEWHAHLVYEDLDFDGIGSDSDSGYALGARYFFAVDVSGGIELRDVSDLETLIVDVRFDF